MVLEIWPWEGLGVLIAWKHSGCLSDGQYYSPTVIGEDPVHPDYLWHDVVRQQDVEVDITKLLIVMVQVPLQTAVHFLEIFHWLQDHLECVRYRDWQWVLGHYLNFTSSLKEMPWPLTSLGTDLPLTSFFFSFFLWSVWFDFFLGNWWLHCLDFSFLDGGWLTLTSFLDNDVMGLCRLCESVGNVTKFLCRESAMSGQNWKSSTTYWRPLYQAWHSSSSLHFQGTRHPTLQTNEFSKN